MPLPAIVQAAIVVASTADLPALSPLVGWATRSPLTRESDFGAVLVTVVQPTTTGPWPSVLVLNGATPLGNRHRAVRRLSLGLARAGYLTILPELPGLERGEIDARTAEAAVSVAAAVAAHPDSCGGQVALLGVSAGAGLALLAASDARLAGRVSTVAAIAPFGDLRAVLCLATTGAYEADAGSRLYRTDPLLARVVARSLVASLASPADRQALLSWLPATGDDRDPLAVMPPEEHARLGPGGRSAADLLANRDAARFAELYAALPHELHRLVEELSPRRRAGSIAAPVEIVTAPDDGFFPIGEAEELAGAIPGSHLTITPVLDHVRLRPTVRTLVELLRLRGFAIRTLRTASRVRGVERRRRGLGEPGRFLLVGAGGYGVTFTGFAAFLALGVPYAVGSVAAYLLSSALMYVANRRFTFRLGPDGLVGGYPRYFAVGLVASALSLVVLGALVEGAGLDPRLGQPLALLAVSPIVFVLVKRWTFGLSGDRDASLRTT